MRAERILFFPLLALLLALSAPAWSAEPRTLPPIQQKFQAHIEAGLRFFKDQKFDDAIREYLAAQKLHDSPVLLFNIAQAHRKMGRFEEARRMYEQFKLAVPDHPLVPEAEAHASAARANSDLARLESERSTAEQVATDKAREAERLAQLNESLRQKYDEQLIRAGFYEKRRNRSRRIAAGVVAGSAVAVALGLGLGLGLGLPKEPDPGLKLLMVTF